MKLCLLCTSPDSIYTEFLSLYKILITIIHIYGLLSHKLGSAYPKDPVMTIWELNIMLISPSEIYASLTIMKDSKNYPELPQFGSNFELTVAEYSLEHRFIVASFHPPRTIKNVYTGYDGGSVARKIWFSLSGLVIVRKCVEM